MHHVSKLLLATLLLNPTLGVASDCKKPIKIGIIDTGLDLDDSRFEKHLCKTGHTNFVLKETIVDTHSHGTHVAGIIQQYAGEGNYCFVILKYYSDSNTSSMNVQAYEAALSKAKELKLDFVNYSGGGPEFSENEYVIIKTAPKTTFIVAAGNDSMDLSTAGYGYYPASYSNLPNKVVVGALDSQGTKFGTSNFGTAVNFWELGENVMSTVPFFMFKEGVARKSGTSMATALHTGKEVAKRLEACHSR